MVESYIETGSQPITADPADLKYGLSITDPCLGWEMTASALAEAYKSLGEKHHAPEVPPAGADGNVTPVPLRADHSPRDASGKAAK
jgi:3-deoxy-7-phosphoheptulonate synthase